MKPLTHYTPPKMREIRGYASHHTHHRDCAYHAYPRQMTDGRFALDFRVVA